MIRIDKFIGKKWVEFLYLFAISSFDVFYHTVDSDMGL